MLSNPGISTELSDTKPKDVLVTDFFGGVANVEVMEQSQSLDIDAIDAKNWKWSVKTRQSRPGQTAPPQLRPSAPVNRGRRREDRMMMDYGDTGLLESGLALLVCAGAILFGLSRAVQGI